MKAKLSLVVLALINLSFRFINIKNTRDCDGGLHFPDQVISYYPDSLLANGRQQSTLALNPFKILSSSGSWNSLIEWEKSIEAKYYDIYMDGESDSNIILSNFTPTLWYDLPLPSDFKPHVYRIRAKLTKTDGKGLFSSNKITLYRVPIIGKFHFLHPPISNCNGAKSSLSLSWTAATNATSYDITKDGKIIATVKPTTATGSLSKTLTFDWNTKYANELWLSSEFSITAKALTAKPLVGIIQNIDLKNCTPLPSDGGPFSIASVPNPCRNYTKSYQGKKTTLSSFSITWSDPVPARTYEIHISGSPGKNKNGITWGLDEIQELYGSCSKCHYEILFPIGALDRDIHVTAFRNGVPKISKNTITHSFSDCSATSSREKTVESSIDEVNKITLFPNPTTGEFSLNMEGLTTNNPINVTLFDLSGKNVFTSQLMPQNESNAKINITHLPAGIYLVNIAVEGKEYHQKIVKE